MLVPIKCGWCGMTIRVEDWPSVDRDAVSHGICHTCKDAVIAESGARVQTKQITITVFTPKKSAGIPACQRNI